MEGTPWQFDSPAIGNPVLRYANPPSPISRPVRRLLMSVLIIAVIACLSHLGALVVEIGAYLSIGNAAAFSADMHAMASPYPVQVLQPHKLSIIAMLFSTALMLVLLAGYAFRVTRVFDHSTQAGALRRSAQILIAGTILHLLISVAFLGGLYRVVKGLPIRWEGSLRIVDWEGSLLRVAVAVNVLALLFTAGVIWLGKLAARRLENA